FVDTYLIIVEKITLRQVTWEWLQSHNGFIEILMFLGCLGFFYAWVIPFLEYLLDLILALLVFPFHIHIPTRFSLAFAGDKEGREHIAKLRDSAIQHNNPLAYKHYENLRADVDQNNHIGRLAFSVFVLAVVGYFASDTNNPGLFQFICGLLPS